MSRECIKCINTDLNPTIQFSNSGLCCVCESFENNFDPAQLQDELFYLESLISSRQGKYNAMIGMSGGKDSSSTAYLAKEFGFSLLGFTFDIGYYPEHIITRAKQTASRLDIDHKTISIKNYIVPSNLESYSRTAALYDLTVSSATSRLFREQYMKARSHYSVKNSTPMAYVRSCQLCRKTVIPAYYFEALKHDVDLIILGINEWTGLSQNPDSSEFRISGIRKLHPFPDQPAVYVVHLPFLLRIQRSDVETILRKLDWAPPTGEEFVESNSNSCLFARAAENKALNMLGFHPDSMRLAREVTVGFISKEEAFAALRKVRPSAKSVREVLQDAAIL